MSTHVMIPRSVDSGWTNFPLPPGAKQVFVSSSGNDSNNGLTTGTPKLTPAGGRAILSANTGDQLLFKCGDTFTQPLDHWNHSGESATRKLLVGSYGTGARPKFNTGTSTFLDVNDGATIQHVAFVGIEATPNTWDGVTGEPNGVYWLEQSTDVLFEDMYVHGYTANFIIRGSPQLGGSPLYHTDTKVRRCIIDGAHFDSTGSIANGQGLYAYNCINPIIEESVLTRNGWTDVAYGSDQRHNMYIQNGCTGVVVRNNFITDTDGVEFRPGGTFSGNVLSRLRGAVTLGMGSSPEVNGVSVTCNNNIIVEGQTYPSDSGNVVWGIRAGNLIGGTISGNIIANSISTDGQDGEAFRFEVGGAEGTSGNTRTLENVTIDGNIVQDWAGFTLRIFDSGFVGNTFSNNTLQCPNNAVYQHSGYQVYITTALGGGISFSNCHMSRNAAMVGAHGGSDAHIGSTDYAYNSGSPSFYTAVGATGCDTTVQTYAGSANATLGGWYRTMHATTGTEAGDHAAMTALLRGQSRQTWSNGLTATAFQRFVRRTCFS